KRPKEVRRNVTSVSELRATRAVDAITPGFMAWCGRQRGIEAALALEMLGPVTALVSTYVQESPASAATNFDPVAFAAALGQLLGPQDEENEHETVFVIDAINLYLELLLDSDSWTGTKEAFNTIGELFQEDGVGLPEFIVPDLDPAKELAALEGAELAGKAAALLRWLDVGKEVTATGALRLKDIEPAAAAIGLAVRGATPAKAQQESLFGDSGTDAVPVKTVKTMFDEPRLTLLWIVLEQTGLLQIGQGRARPTLDAQNFLTPGSLGRLNLLRDFITMYIHLSVLGPETNPWLAQISTAQTAVLLAATTANPPESIHLRQLAETGPETGLVIDPVTAAFLMERLGAMVELGLLTMGQHVVVLEGLIGCFVGALADSLKFQDEGLELELPDFPPPASSQPTPQPTRPAQRKPKKNTKAQILQLKIMLKSSKPPIWRRLLVRSDLTLTSLHRIIQMFFGWMDCHLHEFRVGGYKGTVYGPAGNDFGFGDPPIEESGVAIGELLAAERTPLPTSMTSVTIGTMPSRWRRSSRSTTAYPPCAAPAAGVPGRPRTAAGCGAGLPWWKPSTIPRTPNTANTATGWGWCSGRRWTRSTSTRTS
ncbi:MAG: plasmid pRiA4b ORF-3 family protein, partial [Specibacter sp.]